MKLRVYDQLLLIGLIGISVYVIYLWMPTAHTTQSFNIFGALFLVFMSTLMLKVVIVTTAIFIEWALPRLSSKYKNFQFPEPGKINFFGKRLEIRIVDKERSKVTF